VLLVALSAKNAILIVEFARDGRKRGESLADAAVNAARVRLRPILMTSVAFNLGVFPLVIATGAGAAGRQALGAAVFGGMIAATLFPIVFVPVFYVVSQAASEWLARRHGKTTPTP
ncbi:MAG TPA: efflux RND transporter permease subunit, partial [Candidatus Brocadiia bacterium]|nr:efflux RND transporter permease subunit [Candidatus Brocadiia bacterium]